MKAKHVDRIAIEKYNGQTLTKAEDWVAVEAPLEISLIHEGPTGKIQQNLTITMRTPGDDPELAIGFLLTEGLITHAQQVLRWQFVGDELSETHLCIELAPGCNPDTRQLDRNFLANSSCGVCGKSSLDHIRQVSHYPTDPNTPRIPLDLLPLLPSSLYQAQSMFQHTGGLHASALFDTSGKLLLVKEDVGRHNALDKTLGAALLQQMLPLHNHILMLSGRISFELVQKAAMAGIGCIAAVGAPSTLAIGLAQEYRITLVGFLRDQTFNVYSEPNRFF